MNILAFDTATHACTIALSVGGKVTARHDIAPKEHASLLLPQIQALCDEASFDLAKLNAIAFGAGPGSFMGVRLATAMAQGLGFGLNVPLIPISTLQILAQTAFEKTGEKDMVVGWDARMDEIYWGLYHIDASGIAQPVTLDQLSRPKAVDIKSHAALGFCLVGNAWSVYANELPPQFHAAASRFTDFYPDAKAMLTIAMQKYQRGETVLPALAHPHYLRHHVANRHA